MIFLSNTYGIYGTGLLTYILPYFIIHLQPKCSYMYHTYGSYGRDRVMFSGPMLNFTG